MTNDAGSFIESGPTGPEVRPVLTVSSLAFREAMGQQVYEECITEIAEASLGRQWSIHRTVIRSMRAPDPGTHRVPARVLYSGSERVRAAVGRCIYRGSDVVHRFDLRLPPFSGPEVLTIHDVAAWRFDDEAAPPKASLSEARRAAAVVCGSRFAANEVREVFGVAEPVVIPHGVSSRFFQAAPLAASELEALGARAPFVTHFGGCSKRKNLAALAEAWPEVHRRIPDAQLILVGRDHPTRTRLFSSLPGIVLAGRLSSPLVPRLMASSSVVVVPSLYEGFGLPALEAMATGAAVVASNRSSLPEVCADGALLVNPDRVGLAEGLIAALDGGSQIVAMAARGRARAKTFTWERSAAAHAEIWDAVRSGAQR